MSAAQVWLAIAGMALITGVTRALFLMGGERMILPERVQRAALRAGRGTGCGRCARPSDYADRPVDLFLESRALRFPVRSRLVSLAPRHAGDDCRRHDCLHGVAAVRLTLVLLRCVMRRVIQAIANSPIPNPGDLRFLRRTGMGIG